MIVIEQRICVSGYNGGGRPVPDGEQIAGCRILRLGGKRLIFLRGRRYVFFAPRKAAATRNQNCSENDAVAAKGSARK